VSALLRLRGRGHPAIRATHAKTLEFSGDPEITGRATCVVAVAAQALNDLPDGLAGPVRIGIRAGGHEATVRALANPGWRPGGTAVVRRSRNRRPDTLATEADLVAADLPRPLVAALADPAIEVEVTVERAPARPDGRTALILMWTPPDGRRPPRLVAETEAADVVVTEGSPSGVPEVSRVLVVSSEGLPGSSVLDLLAVPDKVAVEVAGLPPGYAAAAASPRRAPVVVAGPVRRADLPALVRVAPPAWQLSVTVPVEVLPALAELAAAERGTATAAVVEPDGYAGWGPVERLRSYAGRGAVTCCLDGTDRETSLDPADEALFASLLRHGVSARTLALALAGVPGWSRRRAYDAVRSIAP
jgi:hypothetical protein